MVNSTVNGGQMVGETRIYKSNIFESEIQNLLEIESSKLRNSSIKMINGNITKTYF